MGRPIAEGDRLGGTGKAAWTSRAKFVKRYSSSDQAPGALVRKRGTGSGVWFARGLTSSLGRPIPAGDNTGADV